MLCPDHIHHTPHGLLMLGASSRPVSAGLVNRGLRGHRVAVPRSPRQFPLHPNPTGRPLVTTLVTRSRQSAACCPAIHRASP
ncbi:hypothetical protein VTN96DRAFT_4125 [Rasamsonia emersonii]